jgi:NhaA family Na+:H+ antiporter
MLPLSDSPVRTPEQRLTGPFRVFASARATSGLVLLAAAVAALIWANSPWSGAYTHLLEMRIGFGYARIEFFHSLRFWVNDALMAVFFLLVGLEIKREILVGELASMRVAALPIAAALGGVLVPALIYTAVNAGGAGRNGWGIPMATDIAFVAGALALMGPRVPAALAVFLTALAIVDDIFAVVVIAVFYTGHIHWPALAGAALVWAALAGMNRIGVVSAAAYFVPGLALWILILQSGVHSTIAGVLLAIVIPGRRFLDRGSFLERGRALLNRFEQTSESDGEVEAIVEDIEENCRHVQPPLHRLEQRLRPWVSLFVMPLFAFVNAGFSLSGSRLIAFWNPVTLGVLFGLFLGKPAGILLFSALSTRLGIAGKPETVSWAQIHGAGWLAGIGFTMSLFVGHLAFGDSALMEFAKAGIFAASVLAGITGSLLLVLPRKSASASL